MYIWSLVGFIHLQSNHQKLIRKTLALIISSRTVQELQGESSQIYGLTGNTTKSVLVLPLLSYRFSFEESTYYLLKFAVTVRIRLLESGMKHLKTAVL